MVETGKNRSENMVNCTKIMNQDIKFCVKPNI